MATGCHVLPSGPWLRPAAFVVALAAVLLCWPTATGAQPAGSEEESLPVLEMGHEADARGVTRPAAAEAESSSSGHSRSSTDLRPARTWAYRMALAMVALLLFGGLVRLPRGLRAWRAWPLLERWGLPSAVALGLLARLVWSLAAPLHEHYVGYGRIECAASPGCATITGNYGPGPFAFLHTTFQVLPAGPDAAIVVNAVLGALCVGLVFLAVRRFVGGAGPALGAAVLLALWPAHVRLSASEELGVVGVAILIVAMLATVRALETRRLSDGFLAALAFGLSLQGNLGVLPVAAVWPLAIFGLPRRRRLAALRDPRVWAPFVVVAVLLVPHALDLAARPNLQGPSFYATLDPLRVVRRFVGNSILFDPETTPPAFAVLAVAGLGLMVVAGRARALLPLVATLLLLAVFDNCDPYREMFPTRLRCQGPLTPLLAVSAGGTLAVASGLLRRWRWPSWLLPLLIAAATVPSLPAAHSFVRARYVVQDEYAALRELTPRTPPARWLVVPDRLQPPLPGVSLQGDPVGGWFAASLYRRAHPEMQVDVVEASAWLAGPGEGEALAWVGVPYLAFLPEEVAAAAPLPAVRPALAALRRAYRMEPVVERSFPVRTRPEIRYRFPSTELTVGYYRLIPRDGL